MNTILLTAGVVALMAAVIGGGLKAFQIDMPVLPTVQVRAALGALGIAFLIAAVVLPADDRKENPSPPPPPNALNGTRACSDGRDNDGDGTVDFPHDRGCFSRADRSEKDSPCFDGGDNDGDGKVDFPHDPGCFSRADGSEKDSPCFDGRDNDGDGKVDYPADPGCSSREEPAEKQ
jgi:hypothetical protein